MKRTLLSIWIILLVSGTGYASDGNIPPVAVLTEDPDRTWFYNAEEVIFSGASSTDVDGTVNYYRFYVNGSLKYQGSSSNYSTCFVLNGSANSGCYELGSGATTVSIKLGARDNSGEWDYQTISYTIQEHKGRKYFITDHLGSVRATINRDGNVLGYDDFYPFGKVMPGRSSNSSNPNDLYKFTGHERDEEAGLEMDYMNARNYDPIIGRFLQIDPLSDMFPAWNPYHYVYNNPLGFTDPTGMAPMGQGLNSEQNYSGVNVMNKDDYIFDENGKFTGEIIENDQPDKIVQKNSQTGEIMGEYEFVDQINDPQAVKDGGINLVVVSDEDVNKTLNDAGVFKLFPQLFPKVFLGLESRTGRAGQDAKLDFFTQEITVGGISQYTNSNTFYATSNMAGNFVYNERNFGNFLWGAASKALNVTAPVIEAFSNLDELINSGFLDSMDDQNSIFIGRAQTVVKE